MRTDNNQCTCRFCHEPLCESDGFVFIFDEQTNMFTEVDEVICENCFNTLQELIREGHLDELMEQRIYDKYHFKLEDF